MRTTGVLLLAIGFLGIAAPGAAQSAIPLTVSENRLEGRIELPGGIAADLAITFERVVGLNPAALEVSASLIHAPDVSLLTRLPGGLAARIPATFPVLIQIEPPAASGLSLEGLVTISLYTHNLALDPALPFRLYAAPLGGPFVEITRSVGVGSYRVAGSSPGFSEFILAADTRPSSVIVAEAFDRVDRGLLDHAAAMPSALVASLRARLYQARSYADAGVTASAVAELTAFAEEVQAYSGAAIPAVWRAHDTRVNVAGLLRSATETAKFCLAMRGAALR